MTISSYMYYIFQRYERIRFTTTALTDLFHDEILRPVILFYFGTILVALLQLSFAPLVKPNEEIRQTTKTKTFEQHKFCMTVKRYQDFLCQQKESYVKLISLLSSCPQYKCIQGLMLIHGQQKTPKWLRACTRNILVSKITQPGGVLSLINAICSHRLDIGVNWHALDIISKLLTVSHGRDKNEYYRLVCPQVCVLYTIIRILYDIYCIKHVA